MVDPKELRIGNWITHRAVYSPHRNNATNTNIYAKLEAFDFQWEEGDFCNMSEYGLNYDIFNPIPTTPAWLERLGYWTDIFFEGDRPVYVLPDYQEQMYIDFDNLQPIDAGFPIASRKIEYVHQLQNLYFALTGSELTITEKATT